MTAFSIYQPWYFARRGFAVPGSALPLLLVRVLLYLTIIGSWYYTLSLMPESIWARIGLNWSDLVWYLTVAEIGTFLVGPKHKDIEYQLREGAFQSHLTRPMSWLIIWSWGELGQCALAILLFGISGILFATLVTGQCPITLSLAPFLFIHLMIGAAIWFMLTTCIGLSALWLGSSYVPFWVAQKLNFVLGGMIIPLHLYPEWLATIAYLTPFPAILAIPGQTVLPGAHDGIAPALAYQLLVLVDMYVAMRLIFAAFVHKMVREGR
jgi:ABC-2 type transport system permease protein